MVRPNLAEPPSSAELPNRNEPFGRSLISIHEIILSVKPITVNVKSVNAISIEIICVRAISVHIIRPEFNNAN